MYEARSRLSAEVADNSTMIRSMVVKAEDSRLLGDWKGMKATYSQLYTTNQGLINSYNIRCQNQSDLMAALKIVNQIIQRTANLRGESVSMPNIENLSTEYDLFLLPQLEVREAK